MISLTITRDGLSLPDLTLTDAPDGDYVVESIGRPEFAWEYGQAPRSDDMHGAVLLSATKDMATLPLTVNIHGDTAATLVANEEALLEAFEQWAYTVTLTVDGVLRGTWSCDPTSPRWGEFDAGEVRGHMSKASVVIPVYPVGA